jgi:hypothetical protein
LLLQIWRPDCARRRLWTHHGDFTAIKNGPAFTPHLARYLKGVAEIGSPGQVARSGQARSCRYLIHPKWPDLFGWLRHSSETSQPNFKIN